MIRILAIGKHYFKESWNIFDFVIVAGSIFMIVINYFQFVSVGGALIVIRAFRISRILRLLKKARNLQLVFNTFLHTAPPLLNVGSLILLLLYCYTIVGVFLYGNLMRNGMITESHNFENFGNAFITLFDLSTGDNWADIVQACLV